MSRSSRRAQLLLVGLRLGAALSVTAPSRPASADEVAEASGSDDSPDAPETKAHEPDDGKPDEGKDASLGWWIVASSLATGTIVTLHGLGIECAKDDTGCQRRTSLVIAGGFGIASLGSLIGLTIVQARTEDRASGAVVRVSGSF